VTEAPAAEYTSPVRPAGVDHIEAALSAFRRQLDGQVSVSASVVQDGLLEIWGALPEGSARSQVESWLTETLGRNLYSVADIDTRLSTVLPGKD
jgi:DNA-directed RNA polymerase specialized sigma24 family protein